MQNVRDLIPETIRHTAGYIDTIYKFMTGTDADRAECEIKALQPYSPAGDHPDDRFDVSDEFYWEKEFGVTDADLMRIPGHSGHPFQSNPDTYSI